MRPPCRFQLPRSQKRGIGPITAERPGRTSDSRAEVIPLASGTGICIPHPNSQSANANPVHGHGDCIPRPSALASWPLPADTDLSGAGQTFPPALTCRVRARSLGGQRRCLYKEGDNWKEAHSFGRDDLLVLAKTLDQAHTWICAQKTA